MDSARIQLGEKRQQLIEIPQRNRVFFQKRSRVFLGPFFGSVAKIAIVSFFFRPASFFAFTFSLASFFLCPLAFFFICGRVFCRVFFLWKMQRFFLRVFSPKNEASFSLVFKKKKKTFLCEFLATQIPHQTTQKSKPFFRKIIHFFFV